MDAARAVVRELLPLVQRVTPLNARLEELRGRLGNSSHVPMPFHPYVFETGVWLQAAKRFVGDA